jgi:hypothetical protein
MKITIEILRLADGKQPKVLHTITHDAHLVEPVAAAAQGVIDSADLGRQADSYRIVTEGGAQLWGWANRCETRPSETDEREG